MLLNLKNYLEKSFRFKGLGVAKSYLGINVLQKVDHTVLSQAEYIAELLRNFNMYESKLLSTPMDRSVKQNF